MSSESLGVLIQGRVTPFSAHGRKLGYPTANIASHTTLDDGVYFGFADLHTFKHHPALIFIGTPTTVGDSIRRVEAHLLDIPDEDYYGYNLHLEIVYFHRSTETFPSVAELKDAMKRDETIAREWFARHT